MMWLKQAGKITDKRRKAVIATVVLLSALAGMYFLGSSFAGTFAANGEAENGTVKSPAAVNDDAAAAGGKSVLFGQHAAGTGKLGTRITFGAYTTHAGNADLDWTVSDIQSLETRLGHKVTPVQYFTDFSTDFRLADCQELAKGGRDMLVAWEPDVTTADVINKAADTYIKKFAADVAKCSAKVYIRIYPEMNGNFTPYSPYYDQESPGDSRSTHTASAAQLVQATRHIIDVFRSVNNSNVRWVFCPNQTDEPDSAANAMEKYYPGNTYTDVLAFDAYNWGNGGPFSSWQSAEDIYAEAYQRLTALHPTAPVWVTETSSKEPLADDGYGKDPLHSKGTWITDLFNMTGYPRLTGLVWFDINKQTSPPDSGERDWRVDSSADSLNALKAALKMTP